MNRSYFGPKRLAQEDFLRIEIKYRKFAVLFDVLNRGYLDFILQNAATVKRIGLHLWKESYSENNRACIILHWSTIGSITEKHSKFSTSIPSFFEGEDSFFIERLFR